MIQGEGGEEHAAGDLIEVAEEGTMRRETKEDPPAGNGSNIVVVRRLGPDAVTPLPSHAAAVGVAVGPVGSRPG